MIEAMSDCKRNISVLKSKYDNEVNKTVLYDCFKELYRNTKSTIYKVEMLRLCSKYKLCENCGEDLYNCSCK